MAGDDRNWVKVYTIFDDLAAQIVKGLLEENDITVDVFYYQAGSVLSFASPMAGKGEIRVARDSVKKAEKIITDFESNGS